MHELKYLKVATKRMAGYTGVLGPVRFKDGVSTEMLPRHVRDRMAAGMEFIEVDAEGNEMPAGSHNRLISEYKERAPVIAPLTRQTDAEKAAELSAAQVKNAKVPHLETKESLEKIAEEKGIKGVREIGAKWNVKHRSIPVLIEMILDAQEKSVAARDKKMQERAAAQAEAVKPVETPAAPVEEEKVDEVVSEKTAAAAAAFSAKIKEAAATGNLAAAVSTEE